MNVVVVLLWFSINPSRGAGRFFLLEQGQGCSCVVVIEEFNEKKNAFLLAAVNLSSLSPKQSQKLLGFPKSFDRNVEVVDTATQP